MDSILILIFLTGLTGFSGYFFQAFRMKAWKFQSPSAKSKDIKLGCDKEFGPEIQIKDMAKQKG